jgi:hypothetical protein
MESGENRKSMVPAMGRKVFWVTKDEIKFMKEVHATYTYRKQEKNGTLYFWEFLMLFTCCVFAVFWQSIQLELKIERG